jgi:hypothetical protein
MKRFLIATAAVAALATPALASSQLALSDGVSNGTYTTSELAQIHFADSHGNRDGNRQILRGVSDGTVSPALVVVSYAHDKMIKGDLF